MKKADYCLCPVCKKKLSRKRRDAHIAKEHPAYKPDIKTEVLR